MKILSGGFLLLALWTFISVFLYVNKIRDFSIPVQQVQAETVAPPPPAPAVIKPEKLLIYFDSDKSMFKSDEAAEKQLNQFGAWIKENPQTRISITGHADASGSNTYNMELGNKRAQSIKDYMTGKGIPAENLITSSRGEDEPAATNDTQEGKAKNRRSEIIIK